MKKYFLILFSLVIAQSAIGQTMLSEEKNEIRSDKVNKLQCEYRNPGPSGERVIWSFQRLNSTDRPYELRYYPNDSDSTRFIGVEHNTAYHFQKKADSLFLVKYANRTLVLDYSQPELRLRYPFRYGDSISCQFKASGYYSQRLPVRLSGESFVKADGFGMLVLPSGDTLKQVLRINTLRKIQFYMEADSNRMIHNCYTWYARGYRYPILECISTTLSDTSEKHMATTFFYPPESHKYELKEDIANQTDFEAMLIEYENNPNIDSLNMAQWRDMEGNLLSIDIPENTSQNPNESIPPELKEFCDYFNHYPSPVRDNLTIEYNLKREANVEITIFDSGFKLLLQSASQPRQKGKHQTSFNLSGYMPGAYHIHCLIDGKQIRRTIIKSL